MSNATISDDEIAHFLSLPKTGTVSAFSQSIKGIAYEMASGVIVSSDQVPVYPKGVTVEILCRYSKKTQKALFKFTLFVTKHKVRNRVYQLDSSNYGTGTKDDHTWPHEHIGSNRVTFGDDFPSDFSSALARFCDKTNITFEEQITSPLEFSLK